MQNTQSMTELDKKMVYFRDLTNDEMREIVGANIANPDELHQLLQYHMGWRNRNFEPENRPVGKMIRPILCLLVCEAAGGDSQMALPAAAAIELLHNFTLIHDDIEDGSPSRRGRDTLWKICGEAKAINAGDAMFSYAQLALLQSAESGVSPELLVTLMRRFNETCVGLTQGQHADMSFETRDDVTVEQYVQMIRGKTALLVAFSAEMGARIAGADESTIEHYWQYGLELGLAFQIIDDLLGIWGDENTIGKSIQSDILTKKKTYPILYGLNASTALREHFEQPATSANFVPRTIELLDEVNARSHTEQTANNYSQSAIDHLQAASPSGSGNSNIDLLTEKLLKRTS